jgi:hypothetical protein
MIKKLLLIFFLIITSTINSLAIDNYEKTDRIALLSSLYSISGTLMLSSFITGNIALNNTNNDL